ncbi:hypothetical protein Pelo_11276 [Pelomyxa schiedti]|nr:hypothetical protein Pelo_11276 [Pelomyxa schiedti]
MGGTTRTVVYQRGTVSFGVSPLLVSVTRPAVRLSLAGDEHPRGTCMHLRIPITASEFDLEQLMQPIECAGGTGTIVISDCMSEAFSKAVAMMLHIHATYSKLRGCDLTENQSLGNRTKDLENEK